MVTFTKHASRAVRLGLAVGASMLALWSALALQTAAQDSGGSDWEPGSSESKCVPRCRSGHECRHGECLPICSPACGHGYLCTSGGTCVRTEAPPPTTSSNQGWGGSSSQCLPSCRTGFLCVSGQCVSACNPACPADQTCTEQGECVVGNASNAAAPPTQSGPTKPEPEKSERSSSADSIVNLHADVAGLLQFGLTPTVEVGKKFSGYLRVRPLNTGLLSYFLLARGEGDTFKWGIGAALGMHIFSAGAGNMRGVFGGPALEYAFAQTTNEKIHKATYGTHVLIPQLDLGYRWGFDSFLLGLGGRIGLSIPVASYDRAMGVNGCAFPSSCDDERQIYFFGGIFVDIGWFL